MKAPRVAFLCAMRARGVQLSGGPEDFALQMWWQQERLIRAKEACAIIAAAAGSDKLQSSLQDYFDALFPELAQDREDFMTRAIREMKKTADKVIELKMADDGAIEAKEEEYDPEKHRPRPRRRIAKNPGR